MVGSRVAGKKEKREMEEYLFRNAYVVGEHIMKGSVRILDRQVPEPPKSDRTAGLACFSEKLLAFRGRYRARIVGNTLQILSGRSKKDRIIASIPASELESMEQALSGRREVMAGGWLVTAWEKGASDFRKSSIVFLRSFTRCIRQVEKGEKPSYHDNSAFYRVDPSLQGRIVTLYYLWRKKDAVVIDSKGRIIPHTVAYPLRYPEGVPWLEREYCRP